MPCAGEALWAVRYNEYSAISGYCGIAKCLCQGSHFCGWGEKIIDVHLAEVARDTLTQSPQISLGRSSWRLLMSPLMSLFPLQQNGEGAFSMCVASNPWNYIFNKKKKKLNKRTIKRKGTFTKIRIRGETHPNILCYWTASTSMHRNAFFPPKDAVTDTKELTNAQTKEIQKHCCNEGIWNV